MNNTFRKSISGILIIAICAPAVFLAAVPETADAYVPIDQKGFGLAQAISCFFDPTSKDNCHDILAWGFAKIALFVIANLIMNWVRTGNADFAETFYGGAQTWILNFKQYLTDAANHAAGIFIGELVSPEVQDLLCSPFRVPLTDYFRNTYGNGFPPFPHARCTLTDIIGNIEDFHADYYNGGADVFLNTWMNPSNNPMGAVVVKTQRLQQMALEEERSAKLESQSNQGFIGQKKCVEYFNESTIGGDNIIRCRRYENVTPGKTVQDQLARALATQMGTWEHADELSEIIAQIVVGLAGDLITRGLNGGLGGP